MTSKLMLTLGAALLSGCAGLTQQDSVSLNALLPSLLAGNDLPAETSLNDKSTLQLGSEGLVAGCWLLLWLLGAGCWLLGPGCLVMVADCWLLVVGCWLPVAGCWSLVAGCGSLIAGCRFLAAGCWLMVAG